MGRTSTGAGVGIAGGVGYVQGRGGIGVGWG